jgi:pimeloyl-ACP methyl ester carboxylesterase
VDLPGFGESYCIEERGPTLIEASILVSQLIRRLTSQGELVSIVGHDVGGAIAQICSWSPGSEVRHLVLVNSEFVTHPVRKIPLGWLGARARRRLHKLTTASRLEKAAAALLSGPWHGRRERASLGLSWATLHESWPGPMERKAWMEDCKRSSRPVLILWGARDIQGSRVAALELLREIPEAYYYENESCGHWPQLERPDWVSGRMRDFLFRTRNAASARLRSLG